ncbi:MAG TPA: hypothetical protein VMH39_16020, partial [Gemmatimonadaceae bacterium]|nr:hypothetical protein [Gemmatimonadaceae bacterium]
VQPRPFSLIHRAIHRVNAPRTNDIAGWERDSVALALSINDLTTKVGDLNVAFVEQGVKDLR